MGGMRSLHCLFYLKVMIRGQHLENVNLESRILPNGFYKHVRKKRTKFKWLTMNANGGIF